MSQFIGELKGSSGSEVFKRGSASSGLHYKVKGFQVRLEVHSTFDRATGEERHFLYMAPGGNYKKKPPVKFGMVFDCNGEPGFHLINQEGGNA